MYESYMALGEAPTRRAWEISIMDGVVLDAMKRGQDSSYSRPSYRLFSHLSTPRRLRPQDVTCRETRSLNRNLTTPS